jgi:hypothetical protein
LHHFGIIKHLLTRYSGNSKFIKLLTFHLKTSHSIYLPKQSHQTKSQEFPEHFHSFTDIIFQFKFRFWLSDLLNRAIDSDIKVLNREGDRLNYHPLPCDRLNWHMFLNQWEDRKFTWNIII